MPFTTVSYYNWLFENENWPVTDFDGLGSAEASSLRGLTISASNPHSSESRTSGQSILSGLSDYGSKTANVSYPYNPATQYYSEETPSPETSAANQILAMSKLAESNMAAALGYHDGKPTVVSMSTKFQEYLPTPTISRSTQEIRLNEAGRSEEYRKLPLMNEAAREGVLQMISRSNPRTPDGLEITKDHPLLTLPVLQDYCNLYFEHFHVSYPILHRATFDPSLVDPLLLTSVLLLGATYSSKDSHLFAICVHDTMRAQIFGSNAFNTRPTLWMLQTILLIECFGKSRAGQLQHDMSHLFHGLLIK